MDPQELVPLEAAIPRARQHRQVSLSPRSCCKGPIRLCRLLAFLILLPSLFIFIPLYMRYRVFSGQMYPMSMTDMRLIDSKISPTWCQRQLVRSNATFNAFVVPGPPELMQELVPVTMTRRLELEDDMKEYWGFYLLQGSTVTVSACVRWPGASLIMIKGYKHLQECAYIGDDSSEELDELLEAHKLGLLTNATFIQKIQELKKVDGKANDPDAMRRHKAGISFHDPEKTTNVTSLDSVPTADITDHDPKELRAILEHLHAIRQAAKTESFKTYQPPSHLMSVPALHRHRDTNVDRDERRWLSFRDIDGNASEQLKEKTGIDSNNITSYNNKTVNSQHNALNVTRTGKDDANLSINNTMNMNYIENTNDNKDIVTINIRTSKVEVNKEIGNKVYGENNDIDKDTKPDGSIKSENNNNVDKAIPRDGSMNLKSNGSSEVNSREVFEDVLKQLQSLGDRGKRVLMKLQESVGRSSEYKKVKDDVSNVMGDGDAELDHLREVLVEAIDEERTRTQRQQKRRDAREEARAKRELLLGQLDLTKEFNEDDEARDFAAEEGLAPDGYAEDHQQVNETTAFDMSNSEYWSSFSSSEEALLECEGLILNLPLTPHPGCREDASDVETMHAASRNALTYRVPANGYYFFVFNSENEVQKNFIKARFDLQKTRYDVARSTLRECRNSTDRCDLPLDIFTSQKVVLELPLRNNDSLWNEQFVIISECEPRTSVYLVCVIAVPVLILMFAFQ